jgi:hypothetical protein
MTYISLNRFFFRLSISDATVKTLNKSKSDNDFCWLPQWSIVTTDFGLYFKEKKQVFSDTRRERLEGYNKSLVKVHSIHIKISWRKKKPTTSAGDRNRRLLSFSSCIFTTYIQDCQGKWDIGRVGCCVASKRWGESLLRFNKLKEEEEQEKNPEGGS